MRYSYIILLLCLATWCLPTQAQTDKQWLRKGNKAYRRADYNKAEENYKKSLSANPANHRATYNLGCVAMARQMQDNADSVAVNYFVQAAERQTDKTLKAQAFHNLGIIHQRHENYTSAIDAYKHTLRLTPNNAIARYNLELCKRLQKQQNQQNQQQNQNNQQGGQGNQDNKDDKNKQNPQSNQGNQNNKDNQNRQQPQPQSGQMSKDNARQMLNAAMQEEKKTQQRMQQHRRQGGTNRHEKNW